MEGHSSPSFTFSPMEPHAGGIEVCFSCSLHYVVVADDWDPSLDGNGLTQVDIGLW